MSNDCIRCGGQLLNKGWWKVFILDVKGLVDNIPAQARQDKTTRRLGMSPSSKEATRSEEG